MFVIISSDAQAFFYFTCLRFVPMTKTVLLGLTLAAVLTMAIVFPAVADAITPIKQTEIKVKKGEISKLRFQLEGNVETQPFGGYAIFTDEGAVVAVTSHAGFYDSETQGEPTIEAISFDGPAAVCGEGSEGCGAEWHTHLVVPDVDSPYCDFASVSELTFEEPSDRLNVAGNNLIIRGVDIGTNSFTRALASGTDDFTVGNPQEGGAAFDLNPAVFGGSLHAVCIGDVADLSDTEALCLDLGTGERDPSALDFIAEHNTAGDFRLDVEEFPYSDDIWNAANTNQNGATNASVVGGVELANWFNANCVE